MRRITSKRKQGTSAPKEQPLITQGRLFAVSCGLYVFLRMRMLREDFLALAARLTRYQREVDRYVEMRSALVRMYGSQALQIERELWYRFGR